MVSRTRRLTSVWCEFLESSNNHSSKIGVEDTLSGFHICCTMFYYFYICSVTLRCETAKRLIAQSSTKPVVSFITTVRHIQENTVSTASKNQCKGKRSESARNNFGLQCQCERLPERPHHNPLCPITRRAMPCAPEESWEYASLRLSQAKNRRLPNFYIYMLLSVESWHSHAGYSHESGNRQGKCGSIRVEDPR